ncbi:hypothetical protein BW716_35395 [[Flexibacter] sp. ATCC 35208]|nr:hypothetical protein BW716_35395 [[Flexibacter] sp. ATCC 35208]
MKELLQTGLELINDSQLNHCPLCNQTYSSHSELLIKVTTNKTIEDNILLSLSQKSSLIQEIESIREKINKNKEQLLRFLTGQHSTITLIYSNNHALLQNLDIQLVGINELIKTTEASIIKKKIQLENKSAEQLIAYLNSLIIDLNQKLESFKTTRNNIEQELLNTKKEIGLNQDNEVVYTF